MITVPAGSGRFVNTWMPRAAFTSGSFKIPFSTIIFTNATLKDMAAKAPRTRAQMLRVAGVGEGKMQRYGDAFLREIAAYEEDEA